VLDCKIVYLIIVENTRGKPDLKVGGGHRTSADIGVRSQEGSGGSSLRRASPTQGCRANGRIIIIIYRYHD
jgi:hypothetical protein